MSNVIRLPGTGTSLALDTGYQRRRFIRRVALAFLAGAAAVTLLLLISMQIAYADDGSGSGSGSGSVVTPSSTIADPVDDPAEAIRDVRDAWKVLWAAGVAAALIVLCKFAGRFKTKIKWLAIGWRPVAIGVIGGAAAGVYDAAMLGGSGVALLVALVIGGAAAYRAAPSS